MRLGSLADQIGQLLRGAVRGGGYHKNFIRLLIFFAEFSFSQVSEHFIFVEVGCGGVVEISCFFQWTSSYIGFYMGQVEKPRFYSGKLRHYVFVEVTLLFYVHWLQRFMFYLYLYQSLPIFS